MTFCTQCGHELGASRTCGDCGRRAAVEPPPAPAQPTHGPRYPLYADEVDEPDGTAAVTAVREPLPAVAVVSPRRARTRLTAAVALGLVLVLVAALRLLGRPGGDGPAPAAAHGTGRELAGTATAEVPATAPAGTDTEGNTTTYDPEHLLDGDPSTAWRMAGDGTGATLTFSFREPVTLDSVGLVNGYAKSSHQGRRTLDWYAGNRRVLAVEWRFDDGTVLPQRLSETRKLQRVDVPGVTTRSVRLRLVTVSSPGKGAAARDTTPLSEVSLHGDA